MTAAFGLRYFKQYGNKRSAKNTQGCLSFYLNVLKTTQIAKLLLSLMSAETLDVDECLFGFFFWSN